VKHFALAVTEFYFISYSIFLSYHSYFNSNTVFHNTCISSQKVILWKLYGYVLYHQETWQQEHPAILELGQTCQPEMTLVVEGE